ncbi:family 78 glycoside hydrolase catalytic domain [Lewinella sp. IMCC34191]|uniref:family 78 glycoside hydrolase catalytic domain n=1 Tax=Lewinella sp. IMCC34191 TaxID=2259172 RepID=UPI000E243E2F|nr:family 78 glycoside hydrolase catalytic domain [Lewinella sp. IMCC34191]
MQTNNRFPGLDNRRSGSILVWIFILVMLAAWTRLTAQQPVALEVEYTPTPLGIDVETPRFSWQLEADADRRGIRQTAYALIVTDEIGTEVWNSGRVNSGTALGIPYAGDRLDPTTRYDWEVTVYDERDSSYVATSWFETGLLNATEDAWEGAEWIGGGDADQVLHAHYLSVFRLSYSLQLDEASGSTRASLILGANDLRLRDAYKNIYGLSSPKDSAYVRLEVDISEPHPTFRVYRVGYHPDDRADRPLYSIVLPDSVQGESSLYGPYRVEISSVFGTTRIRLNGTEIGTDAENYYSGGWGRGGLVINPNGPSGDYIAFPMLADIGFAVPAGEQAIFSDLTLRHYRAPSNVLWQPTGEADGFAAQLARETEGKIELRDDGILVRGGSEGTFAVADPSRNAAPMLRTTFAAKPNVTRARIYVTARGVYELILNGERVGEDYFNPGLTQYDESHLYQTYDVTDRIAAGGENALGAWLGEGWWSGNYTFSGLNWNFFGDRQSLLAKLVIEYADGSRQVIATDPESWRYYADGPLRYGSFFQGEVYDARLNTVVNGWTTADYEDAGWSDAQVVDVAETAFIGDDNGRTIDYGDYRLRGQIGPPARVVKELTARSVEEVRPGVFVYDMGQNMVGVPRVDLGEMEAGRDIWLRYAEVLYPDLPAYGDKVGMIMMENLRAAHNHDHYITKAGENLIQPRFTFHGYRFLEITGIEEALPVAAVKGLVLSSIDEVTAHYETSNANVNRLFQNIVWSQYGNFLSIPTDCPQRNERMGWSGDISVFARTATYLAEVDQFFRRHLLAMRETQYPDGRMADVAPAADGFGGILWGSAGITVAWETWQQYGDTAVLREHYPAMRDYMDFLAGGIDPESGVMTAGVLGDWLSPESNQNDNTLLFESYYIFDLQVMRDVAQILGKRAESAEYAAQIQARQRHFRDTYLEPDGYRTVRSGYVVRGFGPPPEAQARTINGRLNYVDTQVSYALPLALGAVEGETADSLAALLVASVRRRNEDDGGGVQPANSLMTGFIGTAWISKALSDYGYTGVAYDLLLNEQYPSWLYPVTQGATSIWERLNSYTEEDGFGDNNSMNSFNHYSFGAVGQWMIAHSLGIQRGEPGFKTFVLRPEPDPTGQLSEAGGYYDSPYGRIASEWVIEAGGMTYNTTVPPNTSALLYLPAADAEGIREGAGPADGAEGVRFVRHTGRHAVYELTPGDYRFRVAR